MNITLDRIELSDDDAGLLTQASRLMSAALDRAHAGRIELVSETEGGETTRLEVPPATLKVLSQFLALMARQQAFVLYPDASELTSKQAAEVLGVSRPYLIGILEKGAVPFRKVGRHRRILMTDLLAYRETMKANRHKALDELVQSSEAIEGYDL